MKISANKMTFGAAIVFAFTLSFHGTRIHAQPPKSDSDSIRFATFNVSLNRPAAGRLIADLKTLDNEQARKIAEIIQRVRPDVLLINELDYDAAGTAAQLLQENYLSVSQNGQAPLEFKHRFVAPVNTGVPCGFDLNNDGEHSGPEDAFGYGRFPGQYGMVVYSKFSWDRAKIRTFQRFLWKDMPEAMLPVDPGTGQAFYTPEELAILRLSSKSHWDIPLMIGHRIVYFLVCHPTPPAFDGPEDRNGRRNHDEIRLFADYIHPDRGQYVCDDRGVHGGLKAGAHFVIAGDLNADPDDGKDTAGTIQQLLRHPLIAHDKAPRSQGGSEQAKLQGDANRHHRGDPAHDTGDFNDTGPGNLRVDYVLPSRTFKIVGSGVYWPRRDEVGFDLVGASDHRLVWIDVQW